MPSILLVEDDPFLGESLKTAVEFEGYKVTWGKNIKDSETLASENQFDLVILDVSLPDGSGLNFCKHLRDNRVSAPIIFLTAQTDEDNVIKGFEMGGNDYMRKPFSQKELMARIHVHLHKRPRSQDQLVFLDLLIQIDQRKVLLNGQPVTLNRREFDILKYMAENPESIITREMIIQRLEGSEDTSDRTVDSHISHIRAKLKKAGAKNIKIKAEYGIGYRLTAHDPH